MIKRWSVMKWSSYSGIFAILGVLTFLFLPKQPELVRAADGCVTKNFQTVMYKNACAKGGQKEAKDVAKKFMKQTKIKSCNQCHSKLAPKYDLKPDALAQFKKLGGKTIK